MPPNLIDFTAEEADFFYVPVMGACFMSRFTGTTVRHNLRTFALQNFQTEDLDYWSSALHVRLPPSPSPASSYYKSLGMSIHRPLNRRALLTRCRYTVERVA